MKIYELAKRLDISALDLVLIIRTKFNLPVRNHMSDLTREQVDKIREFYSDVKVGVSKLKVKTILRKNPNNPKIVVFDGKITSKFKSILNDKQWEEIKLRSLMNGAQKRYKFSSELAYFLDLKRIY